MAYKYLCGTPTEHCNGSKYTTDQRLPKKCHGSTTEAFRCYRRYLIKVMGFTSIGPREFINPENGRCRVLTKKIRFGARLRPGKENGFMPDGSTGLAGVITG